MKRNSGLIWFMLSAMLFASASVFAIEVENTLAVRLEAIKKEKDAGNYLTARKLYEDLMKDPIITKDEIQKLRAEYENLNMQLLFSRFEMPGSKMYVVEPGDSLYEIAKKHKTTVGLIKKSNGLTSDTIYPGMKLKVITGTFEVRVDKSDNKLKLLLDGKPMKQYLVATGRDNNTPVGEFKIINKLENPTWYKAGAVVPPDSPENILGTRWLGFDYPGYGIHGTTVPESIGTQASAGCIRMRNEEVEELYMIIPAGTKVIIKD